MGDDVVGTALSDYYNDNYSVNITVKSSISEDDEIAIAYMFREEKELPELERVALDHCKGNVLDVGAGAGCHSVILKKRGLDVKAIDTSKGAVDVMKKRGVDASVADYYKASGKYDTLLFLMNGLGLAGTLDNLPSFLSKAKSLLHKDGQIILDSSDIKYMYEEEDGSVWFDLNSQYYGEVTYQMEYKGLITNTFDWLFVGLEKLMEIAASLDLKTELLYEDDSHQFLVKLTV